MTSVHDAPESAETCRDMLKQPALLYGWLKIMRPEPGKVTSEPAQPFALLRKGKGALVLQEQAASQLSRAGRMLRLSWEGIRTGWTSCCLGHCSS